MTGHARLADLFTDAWQKLRRPLVPTVVVVLILLAGTCAVFGTTGIALASQQRTLDTINSPRGRLIVVTDRQGDAALSPVSVDAIARLNGVEWVAGVGPANDVSNSNLPNGTATQARDFYGELPHPIHASTTPSSDQALTGPGLAATLGLGDGAGAISSRTRSATVVGSFTASEPLTDLNGDVLIRTATSRGRLLILWVSVHDIADLELVTQAVRNTVIAKQPGSLRIDTAADLVHLSAQVLGEMARSAQLTVSALLAAVTVLISAVQFGRVSAMARDIGRRRALGASRNGILVQVILNAALCALIGTALGTAAGLVIAWLVAGAALP